MWNQEIVQIKKREVIIIKTKAKKVIELIIIVMLFAILFLIVPQKEVKAVGYGLIGQVGKRVSNSDLQKMNLNFKNVQVSSNLSGAYTNNSSGYAMGNGIETYMPIDTYTFRANNAFSFNGSSFDLLMTVRVNDVSSTVTGRKGVTTILRNGVSSNLDIQIYNYNASVIVTYDIFYTGTSNHAEYNFAYGFGDPDGGDYLYSGVLNSDVYYIPATQEGGSYSFENAFRISSEGIKVVAANCSFDDGLIVIANNNPSSGFSINWSTMPDSARPYMADYMFIPNIYYKPTTLNIRMNMNGGYLDSEHGSIIGTSGDFITLYQSTTIHQLLFGQSLGSDGLANYNNSSYINIKRKGYYVPAGQEFYTLDGNNNKTYFNQTTAYAATAFAPNDGQSHTVTLYINWIPKTYTVRYEGNGGTWNNQTSWSNTIVYDQTYTVEYNFYTRTGYTFAGWKDPTGVTWDENWSGKWTYDNGQYGITNNELVLTAQWELAQYSIAYTLNGGNFGTYHPSSGTYNSSVRISNPSRIGYTFTGWTMTNGNTSTALYGSTSAGTINAWNPATTLVTAEYFKNLRSAPGTVTLNANWRINTSTLRIRLNGGSANVAIPAGSTPSTISGNMMYMEEYNTTLQIDNITKPNTSVSESYTVTYNGNGGIVQLASPDDDTFTFTETTSYTFSGWSKSPNPLHGSIEDNIYTFSAENNVVDIITANYTGETMYSEEMKPMANASRVGYQFLGWYTEAEGGTYVGNAGTTFNVREDVTYYAHWSENVITIGVNKNNQAWSGSGMKVALYNNSGQVEYSYENATISGNNVTFHVVRAGSYQIFASMDAQHPNSLVNTGYTCVAGGVGALPNMSNRVDYYTLELIEGIGISAVSGAGTYLKNRAANINATVSNGYTWQGWSVVSGDSPN